MTDARILAQQNGTRTAAKRAGASKVATRPRTSRTINLAEADRHREQALNRRDQSGRSALRHDPDVRAKAMRAELVRRLASAELTYHSAGATSGSLPPGYHHQNAARVIGSGAETFGAATAELFSWQAHLRAGLRVTASTATAEPGTVVLLGFGVGPLRLRVPCRVVYTITEPQRKGFAYGTLPGHPESGEEAFTISHRDDGLIIFTISAFSRPATTVARAAGPLGLMIQRHFTQSYLRALAHGRAGL